MTESEQEFFGLIEERQPRQNRREGSKIGSQDVHYNSYPDPQKDNEDLPIMPFSNSSGTAEREGSSQSIFILAQDIHSGVSPLKELFNMVFYSLKMSTF